MLTCRSGGHQPWGWQDRGVEGQLWSDSTVNLAASCSDERVCLVCLEATAPLLPASAAGLTWELVLGCSSFFFFFFPRKFPCCIHCRKISGGREIIQLVGTGCV